ncbi:MAG: glycosyltransferase family 39 protein, partial [Pseudomonadota bacterium]
MSLQPPLSRVVTLVLIALIAIGVVLRVRALGFPSNFTFDEELFAHNAHNYLLGLRDDNDHPPLGKLLMAVGLLLFGYNSLGWRFISLCFGLQILLVGYWLGRTLFGTQRSGLFAAAFLAADGFFIAYSRVGLLDGMLTCLVLWSVIAASTARGVFGVLRAALLVGLAASIKWSGALALFPCLAACLLIARVRRSAILAFAIVPLVHVAVWSFGLRITGQASDLHSLWKVMADLFRHHLELGHHQNAAASPWYTWPVMGHPIVVKLSQHGTTQRYASSVGNPLLFLAASVTVVLAFAELPFRFFRARRRPCRAVLTKPSAALVAPSAALVAPSAALVAPSARL